MPYDVVRPLKLESSARGGVQNDYAPKELDACADAIPTPAVLLQDTSTSIIDQAVLVSRSGANLVLTDKTTSHVLRELLSSTTGQVGSHNALPDIIHFLSQGPGDGFASGSTLSMGFNGPLCTSKVWFTSAAKTQRIYSEVYTYNGPLVATATYTLYDSNGTQVRAITDTYAYNGPLGAGATRTWS